MYLSQLLRREVGLTPANTSTTLEHDEPQYPDRSRKPAEAPATLKSRFVPAVVLAK
jgi:hypothetical protein